MKIATAPPVFSAATMSVRTPDKALATGLRLVVELKDCAKVFAFDIPLSQALAVANQLETAYHSAIAAN